jgi:hypothetical protein
MAEIIQAIYCDPPIVVARLGGSPTPVVAYSWEESPNPRNDGDTVIAPEWSLEILPDGSVSPFKPDSVRFRDGPLIRPVCPFIEVWARLGERGSAESTWRDVPLTETLLASFGADRSAISLTVDARNLKAARRTQDPDLAYGLFPSVSVRGDQHSPVPLLAVSPPGVRQPMIPRDRNIPLGFVQVLRPRPNPPSPAWPASIDTDVIRLRFTPGRGQVYGPREATEPTPQSTVPPVPEANGFLNSRAGWFNSDAQGGGVLQPADTFDFRGSRALGVVDDTCESRIEVELRLAATAAAARRLRAHANVLVGPPDWAPDRRPFLSIADELNDRSADAAARNAELTGAELDKWVEDLFERAYETVSLMNVDHWRRDRGVQLPSGGLTPAPLPGDEVTPADQAMGRRDPLRNQTLQVPAPSADVPLPLSAHARARHRSLSAAERLRVLLGENPERLKQLVRGPFEVARGENSESSTMRMPPFMRQSNGNPLTLAAWQYELLMTWASQQEAPVAVVTAAAPAVRLEPLSRSAAERQREVLARVNRGRPQ